jgi:Fibronectin type III domain
MKKDVAVLAVSAFLAGFVLLSMASPAAAQGNSAAVTSAPASSHAVGPPLDQVRPIPPKNGVKRVIPVLPTHAISPPSAAPQDPALQQPGTANPLAATGTGGFAGLGVDTGYSVNSIPPDTNGAAGATQYVQWVNEDFAVFNKTGGILYGPAAGNTLWQSVGGACATYNDGDPIAQYDKAAGRWVMMQPVFHSPYYLCIAVSKTSDAITGGWYLYQFPVPNNSRYFPDYPKLAVWPDGYYISFNTFQGNRFLGPTACAVDRSAMLAGQNATIECTSPLGSNHGSLLPSDLDGSTAPPAGTPDYYLDFESNSLNLWKFHADFATPSNSVVTGPFSVSGVAPFSEACGGGACIPQPGTNQSLDSLGDRLMYRLAYRNFGDHESLVVTHSVATGNGNVGLRWYEIRSPGSSPSVYQQGTYSPDFTNSRWMGSIAMDQSGDIALGYSESSSSQYPSIYFTGRTPSDPLGSMETESLVVQGAGSQTSYTRWGDYSSMSIDPGDDCTFYYTNEYLQATGVFNWSTWIVPIKFSNCGGSGSSGSFSLSANPPSVSVTQGSTGTATSSISMTSSGGFAGTVALTATAPSGSGLSISLSPTSISGTQTSTLTVGAGTATAGTYNVTVTGTSSGFPTSSTSVTVTVNGPPAPPTNLTATPGDTQVTLSWSASTGATSYNVLRSTTSGGPYTQLTSGVTSTTFTDTGLIDGTTYYYVVEAVGPYGTSGYSNQASATPQAVTADFSLSASPGNVTLKGSGEADYTVSVTGSGSFNGTVNFGVTGLPNGATYTIGSVTGSGSTMLAVTVPSSSGRSDSTLTITGTSGSLTHTTSVGLKVR